MKRMDISEHGSARSTFKVSFSVDAPVEWVISGNYSVIDPDEALQADLVGWSILLARDDNPGGSPLTLFRQAESSSNTLNQTFVVGQLGVGSDRPSSLDGSTTGTFDPGFVYVLGISQSLMALGSDTVTPATASGTITLAFIPEPSTALLLASGLVGLAVRRPRPN